MDLAPPKRGGRRPKAPDVEFSGAEIKVAISGVEDVIASPPPPEVAPAPAVDHSFSRDTSDDTDPVSISDLEAVFHPGHAPPLWASTPEPVSADRAPISAPIESAPSSFQPVSDRDLLVVDRPDTAPPPAAVRRRPVFFDVDDEPAPRSRLFDAAPAPFDPTVPALPVCLDAPLLPDDDLDRNADSGLLDIRTLVARDHELHPKNKRDDNRVDDDIFNLSGGLFAAGSSGRLVAPDMSALIAPLLPESSRPGPLLASPEGAAPRAKTPKPAAAAALSVDTGPLGASPPVVSERRISPAAAAASRRSARAGWAVAIAALGVGLLVVTFKLGRSSTTTTPVMAAETAPVPIAPLDTARSALPTVPTPPVAGPEPTIAARDPGVSVKRDKDPVAAIPPTAAPRSTAPPATTGAVTAPVVTAPVVTAPIVTAPAIVLPPPSSGAEFDKSAATAALAAAAGRAAGCKQADDPAGGATVSITFAPSGRVTSSKVTTPPFQGTKLGGCIASQFRSASVPPFEGAPVSVTKQVTIR